MLTTKSATRVQRPALYAVLLLALLSGLLIAVQPAAADSSGTINWAAPVNITANNGTRSVQPYVAVDSNDNMHLIAKANDKIIYRNNIGNSSGFNAAVEIENGIGDNVTPFLGIAIGPGNVVHIAYTMTGKDNFTYYRRGEIRSGNGVSWSARQQLNSERSFGANLAVGSDGVAHVVWMTNAKNVAYRTVSFNSSSRVFTLGDTEFPKSESTFQARPIITITADNKPHIVFQRGASGSAEMYYARRENGKWVTQNLSNSSGIGSFNGAIGTDGVGLFVAWDENINSHDVVFKYSPDGGQNWTGATPYANSAAYASFPHITYSASNRRAYVVWSDSVYGSGTTDTEVVLREFNPATRITGSAVRISRLSRASDIPVIAVGATRGLIVWQDFTTGQRQVFGAQGTGDGPSLPTPTPIPTACSGTLELLSGANSTNQLTLTGKVTPTNCTPTQIQIGVDGTDPATVTKTAYPADGNISVTVSAAACGPRKVRVIITDASGNASAEFSDSVTVDTDVQATVSATNLKLRNTPLVLGSSIADTSEGGPTDGHPQYTRQRSYLLRVDGSADCSGIKNVVGTSGILTPTSNLLTTSQGLPGDASPGIKTWSVTVRDNSVPSNATGGNTKDYPLSLVYDPLSVDASPTNTAGAPVLAQGATLGETTGNTSIIRQLTFTGVNVTDNLYGSTPGYGPTLAAGRQFWGVWIANSRTSVDPLTDTTLNWSTIALPTDSTAFDPANFSLNWSVFSGLNYNPAATDKAGDYYVYVRFLDGAGNPSQTALQLKVTLAAGYKVPTTYGPEVHR